MAELERPTIQLADASGPQPLADESNYEFLQKLFKGLIDIGNNANFLKDFCRKAKSSFKNRR